MTVPSGTVTGAGIWIAVYSSLGNQVGSSLQVTGTGTSAPYTFSGIAAGTSEYYVQMTNSGGLLNQFWGGSIGSNINCGSCAPWSSAWRTATTAVKVTVTSGGNTSGISFSPPAGGRLVGKVTDTNGGAGIPNVQVSAYTADGNYASTYGYTDSNGNYQSYAGLAPGTYYLFTWNNAGYIDQTYNGVPCPGMSCGTTAGTPVSITSSNVTANFAMSRGASIRGTVTSGGSPVSGAWVSIYNAVGFFVTSGSTQPSDGTYATGALPAGTYYAKAYSSSYLPQYYDGVNCSSCDVTSGTPITIAGTTDATGKNFALIAGGTVVGAITDANTSAGVANWVAVAYNAAGNWIAQSSITIADGRYSIGGLGTDTYFIKAQPYSGSSTYISKLYNGYDCVGCSVTIGTGVPVTAGATVSNINFALQTGGSIAGTVTNTSGGGGLSDIGITVMTASGSTAGSATTVPGGGYSVSGLLAGTYYVKVSSGGAFVPLIYTTGGGLECYSCSSTTGSGVSVALNATTSNINFSLTQGYGISGTVRNSGATVLAGVTVSLYNVIGSFVTSQTTNGSGIYAFTGLSAGSYFVRTSNSIGYVDEVYSTAGHVFCVGCSALSGTAIAVSSGTPSATADFALSSGGRIAGVVTESATGQPVSGVSVRVFSATGTQVAYATTSASGAYTSGAGLPTGTYFVSTYNSLGFIDALYSGIACFGCSALGGTPVSVTTGSTTTGINLVLTPGARITGQVTDSVSHAGVPNVSVWVYSGSGSSLGSGYTNANGDYSVLGLPTGLYYLKTSNWVGYIDTLYSNIPCAGCDVTTGTPVTVSGTAATSGINFALTSGGTIAGHVRDVSTGASLANTSVQVYTALGTWVTSVSSLGDGSYSVRGLPGGSYLVRTYNSLGYINQIYGSSGNINCVLCTVTTGSPVNVSAGATVSAIDFSLTLGRRITGTITGGGNPLPGVSVSIYSSAGSFVTSTTTDLRGVYIAAGLADGDYLVKTSNSLGYIDQVYNGLECLNCSATYGTIVTVNATTPSGSPGIGTANFALILGGRIAGTITDSSGNPLQGIGVSISRSSGQYVTGATSNATGGYISNSGLPAGTYVVRTSNSLGYIDELYDNVTCLNCSVINGTVISLGAGATVSNINFALATGGGIGGSITAAASGSPLPNVWAYVYSSDGKQVASANTNGFGRFYARGLPDGSYFVKTWNSLGYVDQLYSGFPCTGCAVTTGTPVTVTGGAIRTGTNFSLATGSRITGTISAAGSGAPIGGVVVQVYTAAGAYVYGSTSSPTGTYIVSGLLPGTYYARTYNSLGYINQLYGGTPCQSCSVQSGTPIAVPSSGDATANFTLSIGGTITGTVSTATGALGGVWVYAYTTQGASLGSAQTNGSGAYSITGVPTGNYVLRTYNTLGYIDRQYDGQDCIACTFSNGTPVAVTAGSTTPGKNFTLTAGSRVSGVVTDGATGAPVSGVSIQLYSASNAMISSGSTDNAGRYTISMGLPSGTYYAKAVGANGYITMLYGSTCGTCAPNTGTGIGVTLGTVSPSSVNFTLTLGGRISGRVTDASTGLPVSGVSVYVYLPTGGSTVATGTTGADGRYTTQGMPTGSYVLRTNNGLGYVNQVYSGIACVRCVLSSGSQVNVTAGSTLSNIDFNLSSGGRIAGTVTGTGGVPLGGVSIQIYDSTSSTSSVTSAVTRGDGTYLTTGGLMAGNYYVKANGTGAYVSQVYNGTLCAPCDPRTGAPVAVVAGATSTGVNFTLGAGGSISGVVTEAGTGTPIPDVEIDVYNSAGGYVTYAISGTGGDYVTTSGLALGTPAKYYLVTYNQSGYIDQLYKVDTTTGATSTTCGTSCLITNGTAIEITASAPSATGKNFSMPRGGRIEGFVTSAATGLPVSNVSVYVYTAVGIPISWGYTDGVGHYISDGGLPAGNYYVATKNTLGLVDAVYNGTTSLPCAGCSVTSGTAVAVSSGTVSNINLALAAGSTITGRVTDAATSNGLAATVVYVYNSAGVRVATGTTDDSGTYTTRTAVPSGTYYARTSNAGGYIDRLYDTGICLACDVTRGTAIMPDGSTQVTGVNFALTQGGRIAGAVTGPGNVPVPGARIRVFTSAGSLVGETGTNGLGNYTSPGLPPGNYYLRTYNAAGLIDELYDNVPCAPCTISTTGSALVTVTQGNTTGTINFALDQGGLVTGFVADQTTGSPLQGVTVSFYLTDGTTYVGTSAPTDANGFYFISLPVGSYTAQTDPYAGFRPLLPPSSRLPAARANVDVTTGTETSGVGFWLVSCPVVGLTPSSLPIATKGQPYSQQLSTSTSNSFSFSVSDGTLTPGLTMNALGVISGTPTAGGTANFTAAAVDANWCAATKTFALFACSYSLSTTSVSSTYAAGSTTVNLIASTTDCTWTADSAASWLTLTGTTFGTGNGTVTINWTANTAATPRIGTVRIGGQTFTVTQGGVVTQAPFGTVDSPADNATNISGSIAVTGWALDDLEVKKVTICRAPVSAEPVTLAPSCAMNEQVYVGQATLVDGARPDVAATYATRPFNTRAGWGYLMLTNMLPNQGNGTFTLYMYATDAEGNVVRIGQRTFTGANSDSKKPFGAIDTPDQGATVSGTLANYGWVLSPGTAHADPPGGGTVNVFVDGLPIGSPSGWTSRSDLTALFPKASFDGIDTALAVFGIDTTTLTNGVHTIAWGVTDNTGQAEGIGSRYFTVANTLASQRMKPAMRSRAVTGAAASPLLSVSTGYDAPFVGLPAGDDAVRQVMIGSLGRMALRFGAACGGATVGQLPVGATFDGTTFTWQPGPAFLGTYQLNFTCAGAVVVPVEVTITAGR